MSTHTLIIDDDDVGVIDTMTSGAADDSDDDNFLNNYTDDPEGSRPEPRGAHQDTVVKNITPVHIPKTVTLTKSSPFEGLNPIDIKIFTHQFELPVRILVYGGTTAGKSTVI